MPALRHDVANVHSPEYRLVFGYRHVQGVTRCRCADPGNYLLMEQRIDDPLEIRFRCWCGRTIAGRMDSIDELAKFLEKNGGPTS